MEQDRAEPARGARRPAPESKPRRGGGGRQSWAQGRAGSVLALGLAVLIFCAAVPFVHSQTPAPSGNADDESNYTCRDNTSVACASVVVKSRRSEEIEIIGDSEGRQLLTTLLAAFLRGL